MKVLDFQEHLIATMMALEDTYFSMAEKCDQVLLMKTIGQVCATSWQSWARDNDNATM